MNSDEIYQYLRTYVPFYSFSFTCAIFAKAAYTQSNDEWASVSKEWAKDGSCVTDETMVFVNEITKAVIISFRRSVTREDWLHSDVSILLGREGKSSRFLRSYALYKKVRKKYKGYVFVTTGHSLGGALAIYVAIRSNRNENTKTACHAFNPGTGLSFINKYTNKCSSGSCGEIHLYTTGVDVV